MCSEQVADVKPVAAVRVEDGSQVWDAFEDEYTSATLGMPP